MDAFHKAAEQVCEGQQLDMDFEKQLFITEDEYFDMVSKNRSIDCLFPSTWRIVRRSLLPFSKQPFQRRNGIGQGLSDQDDYLDVYGDPQVFGKSTGTDIANNKKTWLLTYALRNATGNNLAELNRLLTHKEDPGRVEQIIQIYNKLSVGKTACERIAHYLDTALNALGALMSVKEGTPY